MLDRQRNVYIMHCIVPSVTDTINILQNAIALKQPFFYIQYQKWIQSSPEVLLTLNQVF